MGSICGRTAKSDVAPVEAPVLVMGVDKGSNPAADKQNQQQNEEQHQEKPPPSASPVVVQKGSTFVPAMARDTSIPTADWVPFDTRRSIAADATVLVGDTPIVYLDRIAKGLPGRIAAKVEFYNPTCSVKDRAAFSMITEAEKKGIITPGKSVLIECTSGNMGVAMAQIGAIRGYRVILLMPSTSSVERRAMMRAFGAEIILLDPSVGIKGGVRRAYQLAIAIPNSVVLDQFVNPANPMIHFETTGREIWRQTEGKVDVLVCGAGTGGTLTGIAQYLKGKNDEIEIYAVEPEEAAVINGCKPAGLHPIQGIGTGFLPDTLDTSLVKEALVIVSNEAVQTARKLALDEGLAVGISSGANVTAALKLAGRPEMQGKLIVTVLPDFGERYLSTVLFKDYFDEVKSMKVSTLDEDVEKYEDLFK